MAAALPKARRNRGDDDLRNRWFSVRISTDVMLPGWRRRHPGVVSAAGAVGVGAAAVEHAWTGRAEDAVTAGTATLALAHLAVGLLGLGFLGLGACVHALVWQAEPGYLLFGVVPLVVGGAVRYLHLGEVNRVDAWRLVDVVNRRGLVLRSPSPAEGFWRTVGLAAAASPLVAFVLSIPASGREAAFAGAVLVFVCCAVHDRRLREIPHRHVRLMRRASGALLRLAVVALAASKAGGHLADLWSRTPADGLAVAVCAMLCAAVPLVSGRAFVRPPVPVNLAANLFRLPFAFGLLPVTVAILHPRPGLAAAAVVIAAAETLLLLLGRDQIALATFAERSAPSFLDENAFDQHSGRWLQDALLSYPRSPAYRLIRALASRAALAARGESLGDKARPPRVGRDALRWTDLADHLLDLVENEVVPRYPARHRDRLRAAQEDARAEISWSRAIVLTRTGSWEEAGEQWKDVAVRNLNLGRPSRELFARTMVVLLLALRPDRPPETAVEHTRLARATTTDPALLSCAALATAAFKGTAVPPGPR